MLMLLQVPRAVSPHLLAFFFSFSRHSGFSTNDEHEGEFLGGGKGEGGRKAQATILW